MSPESEKSLVRVAIARCRMAFDHSFGGQKTFNPFPQHRHLAVVLQIFRTLVAKTKTFDVESNACAAFTSDILLLVAFLAAYPASVTAGLDACGAFWLRRSHFLSGRFGRHDIEWVSNFEGTLYTELEGYTDVEVEGKQASTGLQPAMNSPRL